MSSLIGKRLQGGKYKLEKVLGRGGFGLTFRAHQTYLDQVVVIKTLNESFWSAPNLNDLQRQFQDEARRLALCSHPNVVRVSDFFVEDNLPYMVMDYIPGRSLADMVSPGAVLPESTAVGYIQQIGKALEAVHSKGLLHRDVKPQNIMIHELTGEAILIDFGIARELTQNPAQTHTSIVSEGYAPIEQYLPKARRSAATDIYGLAATLYTLLTGETPVASVLRDRTPLTPVQQLRSDISAPVAVAIAYGMNVELKDRPQSVNRWLAALTQQSARTGRFARNTQQPTKQQANRLTDPQTDPQTGTAFRPAPTPPSLSGMPTQVVAPGRPSAGSRTAATTNNRTVALPIPTEYGTAYQDPKAQAPKKGCGCASTLGILTLAIAGVAAGGGFWLYQNANNWLADSPGLSLPDTIELPTGEENPSEPEASTEENPEDDDDSEEENPEDNDDSTEENPEEDSTPAGNNTVTQQPVNITNQPPILLSTSGNPANAQPGDTGNIPAIPGFSPGDSADQIRGRLGAPTQETTIDGYTTSLYNIVPNRVSLAYAYEPGSNRVQQSEATFSPSTDWILMRTALNGMLDGRSTKEIEDGLRAVRNGERDRVEINRKGFSGAIERNTYGHVHIYVRQ
ncbi:MAG: serine/threonine-protein kinase [Cyanobacteria bacterium J06634_5]